MMRADEEGTCLTIQTCRQLMADLVSAHEGRIFGSAGDSLVAEFPSPVEAVRAATEIQQSIAALTTETAEDHRVQFRIGINLGDVIIEGEDLIGDGVNVAARLQSISEPGGICISASVYEQVSNKVALAWQDLGGQTVKNIAEPVRAYRAKAGIQGPDRPREPKDGTYRRLRVAGIGGALAILAIGAPIAYYL